MFRGIFVLLSSIFVTYCSAAQTCCDSINGCFNDDYPYDHLPVPECFQVSFTLYSNAQPSQAAISVGNIPGSFDTHRRTIFIVHGYRGDAESSEWMTPMKNELLNHDNYNVIVTDWGEGSKALWYPQSAANVRVTAHEIARLSSDLIGRGLSRSNLYCVGHSLGGHTCGHAGKIVRFGRITGLDPAGPMFESYAEQSRLHPNDADYVDVIHTMGEEGFIMDFGTLVPLGHADFYPNGGAIQPGCLNRRKRRMGESLGCSHGRAIDYYIESINTPCFTTRLVCTNERDLPNSCEPCGDFCQSMGLESEIHHAAGKFYVETNGKSPYCQN